MEKNVKAKAIDRIRKRMKEDMQEKTTNMEMGNGKGNNISKGVKVIP